jgi:cytochrome c
MRKILIATAAGAAVVLFQPVARAAEPPAALKEHGCLACHDVDKKKVGPAYKDVSAKYKGKKVEELMASMKSKPVHKSALAKTDDAALKSMLEWVLTQ